MKEGRKEGRKDGTKLRVNQPIHLSDMEMKEKDCMIYYLGRCYLRTRANPCVFIMIVILMMMIIIII
jgi:hypothetical protein